MIIAHGAAAEAVNGVHKIERRMNFDLDRAIAGLLPLNE
jgi:hypothetical protein